MANPDSHRQIGFEQMGIGSVLKRNTLFVPLNQREYSWEEDHVVALFQDLAKAISENAPEYFLGSIVAIPREPGVLEVVDGQQRLATTAILLAAIRNFLAGREADKPIIESIDNYFLTAIKGRERVPRLRLNVTDGTFFECRVVGNDATIKATAISHRRINEAMDRASKHVSQTAKRFNEKDHGDILLSWVEFLEHRAIVILLTVPSDVNAYKMFETLNDRGLRTSQSDLVKSYLFGECISRQAEAQQKWASMKALLESISDEDITIVFLRQMLISMYGYLRDSDVYEMVQKNARGVTSSLQFMTNLETGAADYVALLNPEHEKWNPYPASVRRAIKTLILLGMKPVRPVMLSIARALNPKESDLAFRMLVSMSVRFLIVGGARSGSVEQALATTARSISDGKIKDARTLLESLSKVVPNDTAFEEGFKTATVSQAYLARYYLRSMEKYVKKEPDPYYEPNDDQQIINLEHVLPEKPATDWSQFTAEEAAAFYKRIGNMALLLAKSNSDLRSAPFSKKKLVYADTPYELTRQLAAIVDWNPKTIIERQTKMAELAVKTWPLK
jgi:hypothetical protein